MKKTILTIAIMFCAYTLFAQTSKSTGYSSGNNLHDSLLFDGGDSNPLNFLKGADDKCKIKVQDVFGEATGTFLVDTVVKDACTRVRTKLPVTRQLIRGVELVPGEEITTGGEGYKKENGSLGPNTLALDLGSGAFMTVGRRAALTIDRNCIIHVRKGAVEIAGEFNVSTPRSTVSHKNTKYTVEVVEDGNDTTDIVRVYEGSVEVRLKKYDDSKVKSYGEELKKINEDYQNGKITAEEYGKKADEIAKTYGNAFDTKRMQVTVEAGYMCTVGKTIGDVTPIPADDDRWWEKSEK